MCRCVYKRCVCIKQREHVYTCVWVCVCPCIRLRTLIMPLAIATLITTFLLLIILHIESGLEQNLWKTMKGIETPTQNNKKDISYWFCLARDFITTFSISYGKQSMLFIDVKWAKTHLQDTKEFSFTFLKILGKKQWCFLFVKVLSFQDYTVQIGGCMCRFVIPTSCHPQSHLMGLSL